MNFLFKILFLVLFNSLLVTLIWAYIDSVSVSSSNYPSNTFYFDCVRLATCFVLLIVGVPFFKSKSFKKKILCSSIVILVSTLLASIVLLSLGDSIYQVFTNK